jgi:hypothetical protein
MRECLVYTHKRPAGQQWAKLTPLPGPRGGGGMVYDTATNTLIFAAGAVRIPNTADQSNTWSYNLSQGNNGTWVSQPDIPYMGNHISFVTARDENGLERHYFTGGQTAQNECCGNSKKLVEYVAGPSPYWIARHDALVTRGHASSSTRPYGCGFIVVAGTTNESGKTNSIHYYHTPNDTWYDIGTFSSTLNTPVCNIYKAGDGTDWLYCESPDSTSSQRPIAIP